jgi:hypothetical protein
MAVFCFLQIEEQPRNEAVWERDPQYGIFPQPRAHLLPLTRATLSLLERMRLHAVFNGRQLAWAFVDRRDTSALRLARLADLEIFIEVPFRWSYAAFLVPHSWR